MAETHRDQETGAETPQVKNKAVRPLGILPKNMQAWVLVGISGVIVMVLALSGGKAPKDENAKSAKRVPAVVDPNEARIQEYRNRIEEDARKLAAEQARLRQTQAAMGVVRAPAEDSRQLPPPRTYEGQESAKPEKSAIERDKERREYESLFASNIALSYREPAGKGAAKPEGRSGQPLAMPLQNPHDSFLAPGSILPAPFQARADGEVQAIAPAASTASDPAGQPKQAATIGSPTERGEDSAGLNKAEGKRYRLFEGTVIEAVLTNRLSGHFSGPVNCMVTTNVYSHDRQHLLIPQGSRLLGEVSRVDHFGQERLALSFHRLIMPDGYSMRLDRFQGLNQIGETGLKDKVNHHYARVFGAALAIGALAGLAQQNTHYGIDVSSGDYYRQGVSRSMADSSMRILDRFLNILPSFTIREGHRVKIYLSGDLLVPAYGHHKLPPDL